MIFSKKLLISFILICIMFFNIIPVSILANEKYSIIFDLSTGNESANYMKYAESGEKVVLPTEDDIIDFVPDGKTLKGWTVGNKTFNSGEEVVIDNNITFIAEWENKSTLDYCSIVENIPLYYVFDIDVFKEKGIGIGEYGAQEIAKYVDSLIDDDSITVEGKSIQGGGNFSFYEFAIKIGLFKNGELIDTYDFTYENGKTIKMCGLITVPQHYRDSDSAKKWYAEKYISDNYGYRYYDDYDIISNEELNNQEIVLLTTKNFGTVKYEANALADNLYSYVPKGDAPEPLVILGKDEKISEFHELIAGLPQYYFLDIDIFMEENPSEDNTVFDYAAQKIAEYVDTLIDDESINVEAEVLGAEGTALSTYFDLEISLYKEEELVDVVDFLAENGEERKVFSLITMSHEIDETEEAKIECAKGIIDRYSLGQWGNYSIRKNSQLNAEIVLLDTKEFGTIKYNGSDIDECLFKYFLAGEEEWAELLLVMSEKLFSDVEKSDWFYEYVKYVKDNGMMSGYTSGEDAGKFGPNDPITRGQIVTILYRREGQPAVSGSLNFADKGDSTLWSSNYYNNAILWASQKGIVTGYKDGENAGKFMPDKSITRAEFAIILQRYAKLKGKSVNDSASLTVFYDYTQVEGWETAGLAWAVAKGIISGDKETTPPSLKPHGDATRAEAATMITRFCKNV